MFEKEQFLGKIIQKYIIFVDLMPAKRLKIEKLDGFYSQKNIHICKTSNLLQQAD
jgi:hypothetical protein